MLLDHPVQALLEGIAVGLLLGQHDQKFTSAFAIADSPERMYPGGVPMNRLRLRGNV